MRIFALKMRKSLYSSLWAMSLALLAPSIWAQPVNVYDEKVTSAANIATTISNVGIIGNAFGGSFTVKGFPSCEYPVNSGIEHLFDGGLWVGAVKNGSVSVSTGAIDDASGYSTGKGGFEYTASAPLRERSSLFDSPVYDPAAVSHQDFVSSFTDSATQINTGSASIPIADHLNPLDIKVDFESYNWNFSFANFFVILNFNIINTGKEPLDNVYVGYWADGVIRNVNITPPGGTAFFNKGGNGFIDSLSMAYEFDATGDIGYTDSYIGFKYLGSEQNGACSANPNFSVNYNTWQFRDAASQLFYPQTDAQRFAKLAKGLNDDPNWAQVQQQINQANNRSSLVSVGPFSRLLPGDTLTFSYAVVCARRVLDGNPAATNSPAQRENLIKNAKWAQTAYYGEDENRNCILDPGEDRNGDGLISRFILPSPPDIPKMRVVARENAIDVFWAKNSENSIDPISKRKDFEGYALYKTALGFDMQAVQDLGSDLNLVARWDKIDSVGNNNGFSTIQLPQAVTFEGDTVQYLYKYTFENVANGWQHVVALTSFDEGDAVNNLESLESAPLGNTRRVFAGKPANENLKVNEPFVYPNPYYAGATWEGSSRFEEDRRLIFANLPARCEVRVYTVAGDLIDTFEHNQTYNGSDSRWYSTYSSPENTTFSGGEHSWDLLSQNSQIIARGLYLFTVKDLQSGEIRTGKFAVIK